MLLLEMNSNTISLIGDSNIMMKPSTNFGNFWMWTKMAKFHMLIFKTQLVRRFLLLNFYIFDKTTKKIYLQNVNGRFVGNNNVEKQIFVPYIIRWTKIRLLQSLQTSKILCLIILSLSKSLNNSLWLKENLFFKKIWLLYLAVIIFP